MCKVTIVKIYITADGRGVRFSLKEFESRETANSYILKNPSMADPTRLAKTNMGQIIPVAKDLDGITRIAYCLEKDVPAVTKKLFEDVSVLVEQASSVWAAAWSSAQFWEKLPADERKF